MSTKSFTGREGKPPVTDPKFYPITVGLNRWLNKMAERRDLAVRVFKNTSGAPARYVPNVAEIDLNESLIEKVNPAIAGSPDFVIRHPSIAGACVHEAAHARFSTMDLARIHKRFGARHSSVFALLEEGRCEAQMWPGLTNVERAALQSMVLDIVLGDMREDDEGNPIDVKDPRSMIRLSGLLSARVNVGIVDVMLPKSNKVYVSMVTALGEHFPAFFDIAVEFSNTPLGYYSSSEDRLHDLVRRWIALEDQIMADQPEEEKPEKPEGGGEPGGDEGDEGGGGSGGGQPDESEESGEDEGSGGGGKDEGEPESNDADADGPVQDLDSDDEGEAGDGSEDLGDGKFGDSDDANLGGYASGHRSENGIDTDALAEILKELGEAAAEQEEASGSRLKQEMVGIHKADAARHAERRRRAQEARKKW